MRVGIIGAGAIARRGHLPIYHAIPQIEVVGIADIDQSLAAKVAREFKIPRYFSVAEDLLQDESVELVDICTPPETHPAIVRLAAEKGKHILVEKPLATRLGDALEIQALVEENGIKLCVAQNYRYFPSVLAAKERISKGYLGKTVTIHGWGLAPFPTHWTLNTWLYHQGGALYDFGPHLIDMILWMRDFAPIDRVYASGGDFSQGNMDFVNYAVTNIEFEDGSIAVADISWITGVAFKFALDIYGTGGNLFLDVRNDIFYEVRGFPVPFDDIRLFFRKMWRVGTGVLTGRYFGGAHLYYYPLITDFMSSITGDGKIPVPAEQGMMTTAVLEATIKSINEDRPIYLGDLLKLPKG